MYLMIVSSHTAPRPLVLQMISHPYINLALDSLRNEPQAHQVLTMPGEGEAVPAEVEALRRSGRESLKNCLIPSKEIDGRKPTRQQRESYLCMMDTDVDANHIYGLGSQGHLFRLLEYGQMNRGFIPRVTQMWGACMFHAIRKGMEYPREFTNTHLRRMVVLFIVENFDMLWPLLHVSVLSNFGHIRMPEEEFQQRLSDSTLSDHDRAVHDEPGPFSIHGYLSQLLKPDFYGDELCLLIISMMWKVRITILHAETLRAIKVWHMNVALKADFILVHCSGSHYICLGICFSIL